MIDNIAYYFKHYAIKYELKTKEEMWKFICKKTCSENFSGGFGGGDNGGDSDSNDCVFDNSGCGLTAGMVLTLVLAVPAAAGDEGVMVLVRKGVLVFKVVS